jgi:predicted MFS family arabinose efflux permease
MFIEETKPDKIAIEEEVPEEEKAQEGSVFAVLLKRPTMLIFAVLSAAYSFAYSQGNFSLTLQLRELFGDKAPTLMGGIFFTNGIIVVTMTTIIVYLTKKNKPLFNIAVSGIFFALGFGMLYFIRTYPLFIFSTVVWTIGEILHATNNGVYIADNAPSSHRGRFNSVLSIITGAGSSIGPLVMGGYIQNLGVKYVWPLVFFITILSAVMFYALHLSQSRKSRVRMS